MLAIVGALTERSEDAQDSFIPLLLWWAIEEQAVAEHEAVLGRFCGPAAWKLPLVAQQIAPRLVRRYAALGNDAGYAACARLLDSAPDDAARRALVVALEQEFIGRRLEHVPAALEPVLAKLWNGETADPPVVRFALRLGSAAALERALALAADKSQPEPARLQLIEALGQSAAPAVIDPLLALWGDGQSDAVRQACLAALDHFADERIARHVLDAYGRFSPPVRTRAVGLLAGAKRRPSCCWPPSTLGKSLRRRCRSISCGGSCCMTTPSFRTRSNAAGARSAPPRRAKSRPRSWS